MIGEFPIKNSSQITNELNSILYKKKGGGFMRSRRLAIRLIAGSGLLAFVFVTAYQSVLISYIMAPGVEPPIVDSFADLVNKTNVQLFVEKGLTIDSMLTVIFNLIK